MAAELAGHTAFVTVSGRNIGRAIALELAARGANVVVNARRDADEAAAVAAECAAHGVATEVVIGSAAEHATIDAAAREGERLGGIDIVVSNAAVRPFQSLADTTFADWQAVLDTQLNASFRLASTFVPAMKERGWGRIIHVTGPDAFIGLANRAHNVAAKAALRGLTKALAVELGPAGIRVNSVAPTFVETEMTASFLAEPTFRRGVVDKIPLGRLGTTDEVANAIAFLASPLASLITGTSLVVDGGWTAR